VRSFVIVLQHGFAANSGPTRTPGSEGGADFWTAAKPHNCIVTLALGGLLPNSDSRTPLVLEVREYKKGKANKGQRPVRAGSETTTQTRRREKKEAGHLKKQAGQPWKRTAQLLGKTRQLGEEEKTARPMNKGAIEPCARGSAVPRHVKKKHVNHPQGTAILLPEGTRPQSKHEFRSNNTDEDRKHPWTNLTRAPCQWRERDQTGKGNPSCGRQTHRVTRHQVTSKLPHGNTRKPRCRNSPRNGQAANLGAMFSREDAFLE